MIIFVWETGNSAKCEKHGLARAQIEVVFCAGLSVAPDPEHLTVAEQRFIALGPATEGRPTYIAFYWRDGKIRPISARYMHAREVKRNAQAFSHLRPRPDH